jgi:hypothetical protein
VITFEYLAAPALGNCTRNVYLLAAPAFGVLAIIFQSNWLKACWLL